MTLGTDRVRLSFNPSSNELVEAIKRKAAELIDLCEECKNDVRNAGETIGQHGEILRLWSLAQTEFEDGAMWAVKAATA